MSLELQSILYQSDEVFSITFFAHFSSENSFCVLIAVKVLIFSCVLFFKISFAEQTMLELSIPPLKQNPIGIS